MSSSIFPDFRSPISQAANDTVDHLVVSYGDLFERFSENLLSVLVAMERVLREAPPEIILILSAILAFAAGRKPVFALLTAAGLWFIGALGLWDQAMQTLAIVLVSVWLAILIGLPFGILSATSTTARLVLTPVLDLMQTIPSFVYLIPAAMLFGLGKVPAILATVIYATPPLIRLTSLGIREVDAAVVEAGRAFGATRWQILYRTQIPLSLPSIMQGVNQTTMMALSMVVVASMIGARGIGETVLIGLQRNDTGAGVIGGLAIVVLAVILDRIAQAYGHRLQRHRNVGG